MLLTVTVPILDRLKEQAGLYNFTLITSLGGFIASVVSIVLILASILTFFYLAWGGLNWTMAGGDKGKIEEARNRITGAIIGLVITACAWAIFILLNNFLGLGIAEGAGGTTSSAGGTSTSSGCPRGQCILSTNCTDAYYCPNTAYNAQSFGNCGPNRVCCDCLPN